MPKRRRRSFTAEFKAQVVLEVLSGARSQAEIARQHKLKPELIARWKDVALEGLETLFRGGEQRDQDQERIAELERMVGRLTMEARSRKKTRVAKVTGRGPKRPLLALPWPPSCPRFPGNRCPRGRSSDFCHPRKKASALLPSALRRDGRSS